ncbi:hypothetical protein GGR90_001127 [Sphingopyxis italica]|uniref:Uncharacterized protein n=1 Tax=Sphingopyxis italica TaxID=1129133 RepID=A0A7X5XPR2_9SPHN|nr:hypothetical protein [Sphingopyxis italica]
MLEKGRDIGLITRHAVKRLGEDDIELPRLRVGEQPLNAGTQNHTRARDRGILIDAFDLPPFARCAFAADTLLVGDRRRTLLIGGIASIERGADQDIFLSSRGKRTPTRLPHYDSLARHALRVNACGPSHIYGRSLSLAAFRARTCSRAMCRPIASAMRVKAASTAAGASAEELSFAAVSVRERGASSFFIPAHHRWVDCHFRRGSRAGRRSTD